jgi:amino acid transporter
MALGVVVIMLVLGFAYRSNVLELGGQRGDYGVVSYRLGPRFGVVTGAALLVDYLLTLAVSVAAMTHIGHFLIPDLRGYEVAVGVLIIAVMTLGNLRGVRERSQIVTAVWFGFLLAVAAVSVFGIARRGDDNLIPAISEPASGWTIVLTYGGAIASGAVMVTGIEHLAASGRFHEEPRGRRAGRTLLVAVLASAVAFFLVAYLSWEYRADDWAKGPILLQVTDSVFRERWVLWVVGAAGVAILYAAGSGVYRRFAQLASHLARDAFLPRQLRSLSERYVFSYGVLVLAASAAVVILLSNSNLERLVHVYIVGVFTAIVLSQLAMVQHWTGKIKVQVESRERWRSRSYRSLHVLAMLVAIAVWVDVVIVRIASGAWIAVAVMAGLVLLMWLIHRHYDRVRVDVEIVEGDRSGALPSRTHGIVLVSQFHRPAMRALAYARAMRHDSLVAVAVQVDKRVTRQLENAWAEHPMGMPLVVLGSPYRDFIGPIITYVRAVRRGSQREVVVVYVPEYIVDRWWERFLHNKSGARLRARLLEIPGVVVTAVPWHLHASSPSARS